MNIQVSSYSMTLTSALLIRYKEYGLRGTSQIHSHPAFSKNLTGIFTAVMLPGSAHAGLLVQHEFSDYGFEFKMFENELFISST